MSGDEFTLIDVELLRQRRRELGFTVRSLAATAGVSQTVIRGIEHRRNHLSVELGLLNRLATALALPLPTLLLTASNTSTAAPTTVERVGAAMFALRARRSAADLAAGLKLTTEEVLEAIDALNKALHPLGGEIHRTRFSPAPRSDVIRPAEQRRLRRTTAARTDLTKAQARMLARVINGEVPNAALGGGLVGGWERSALGYLRKHRFIRAARSGQFELDPDVAFSLGLTNQRPRLKTVKKIRMSPPLTSTTHQHAPDLT